MSVRDNTLIIFNLQNQLTWIEHKREEDISSGHAFICEGQLIITNYHVISSSEKIYCDYGELKVLSKSYINDIAVLTFIDKSNFEYFPEPISIKQLNPELPKINEELFFSDKKISVDSISYEKNNKNNINAVFINCGEKINNGYSGSCCYNSNNEVVGIITQYDPEKKCSQIIPTIYILNIIKLQRFYKLPFDYNIDNNNLVITYSDNKKIKEYDTILYINDQKINNGSIFCQNMKYNIDIQTFYTLSLSNKVKLTLLRKGKIKEININGETTETNNYIELFFNRNYINYKGIIFIEINKEIIDYYNGEGINIAGPYIKYNNLKSKEKIVVAIDKLSNIDTNNLIFNHDKFRFVSTIYRINKKKIKCLNDIKKHINKKSIDIEYEFNYDKYNTINL